MLDPIRGGPLVEACSVPSLANHEAMAEKLRAALRRPEVAIRDFVDVARPQPKSATRRSTAPPI
jgi:hypothetical protein